MSRYRIADMLLNIDVPLDVLFDVPLDVLFQPEASVADIIDRPAAAPATLPR